MAVVMRTLAAACMLGVATALLRGDSESRRPSKASAKTHSSWKSSSKTSHVSDKEHATAVTDLHETEGNHDNIKTVQVGKGKNWTLESSVGPMRSPCGTTVPKAKLPACSADALERGKKMSKLLRHDPAKLSEACHEVLLLGDDSSKTTGGPCLASRGDSAAPLSMAVSMQYTNRPRCCTADEYINLVHDESGGQKPWLQRALTTFHNTSSYGHLHYEVLPKEKLCTIQDKCPLVVQVGTTIDSWFLAQSSCEECGKQLRAVLVNPKLMADLPMESGMFIGSSNKYVKAHLLTFVENYLNDHPEIDRERVYIVSLSQGEDTALRAALLRPDLFSAVILAGKMYFTSETADLLKDPTLLTAERLQGSRLRHIQFNVGEDDTVFKDDEFFTTLKTTLSKFAPKAMSFELRTFPEAAHTVWWAAWNAMHEMLWTAEKTIDDYEGQLPLTCS